MSKPRAPTPPDPANTIAAQTQSNTQTAINNAQLNNVNQVTPWGNVTFTSQPGQNGIPNWTQTTSLSPNQQQINDQGEQNSIGLAGLAGQGINTASGVLGSQYNQRRFDGQGVTGGQLDLSSALGDFRGDIEGRQRELMTRGLDDAFGRAEESQRSRLAAQGINAGTDAFESERRSFEAGRGDAYASAELAARQAALGERNQQANEITNQRGINWNEALQQYGLDDQADFNARSRPLNEITSLNSGSQLYYQPTTPGQPNSYNINGTDVAGITQNGFNNQMAGYNAQLQSQQALWGSLAELGSAAITRYSDRRLKRNVEYSHTDANGLRWYAYDYVWGGPRQFGVMADEAPAHAVSIDPRSGFAMVNYGAL